MPSNIIYLELIMRETINKLIGFHPIYVEFNYDLNIKSIEMAILLSFIIYFILSLIQFKHSDLSQECLY